MLPKGNRLDRKEIQSLKGKPDIIQGRFFGLIFKPDNQKKKFGLIVSNNISKKATERNNLKRRLFAVIRQDFFKYPGLFLFLPKKSALLADREQLKEELQKFEEAISHKIT